MWPQLPPSNLIHVNPNGNDLNNGMSENSSKATLSNAIDSVGLKEQYFFLVEYIKVKVIIILQLIRI
ncbi:hypothetical protein [Methanobrevibacter arboriphilus]|uniref:hypothetical protein n=1 Tax=Methanobrevibacter arboriphilus TaxID=39441 RepID=UPI0006D1C3FB|nr:hypothetical protein [Methanobrevibacter arboriphilus]